MIPTSHTVAAAVLVIGDGGHVLMVQTLNRIGRGLVLPGGMVEPGESPTQAASREADEELGLHVEASRLLVVDHRPESRDRSASVHFVFRADRSVSEQQEFVLQADEIAEVHWVDLADVATRHISMGRQRMLAALSALSQDTPMYLES